MLEVNFSESTVTIMIAASAVLLLSIFISFMSRLAFKILSRRYSNDSTTGIGQIILKVIDIPIFLFILSLGFLAAYLLLAISESPFLDPLNDTNEVATTIWRVLVIGLTTFTVARLIDGTIEWYLINISENTNTKWDDTLLPTVRRIVPMAIYLSLIHI